MSTPHLEISSDSCLLGGEGGEAAIFTFHSPRARPDQTREREREKASCSWLTGEASGGPTAPIRPVEAARKALNRVKRTPTERLADMTLLCYNKGCGVTFDSDQNNEGEIRSASSCL